MSFYGPFFPANNSLRLESFSDSDWASCPIYHRSITGFCIYLGFALISWKTKKQHTISHSSTETEYKSLATTTCELQWCASLLQEFVIPLKLPIPLWDDSQEALHIAHNPVFHESTKHLEIDCHLVHDKLKVRFLLPQHISSTNQPTDIFTKALQALYFIKCYSS